MLQADGQTLMSRTIEGNTDHQATAAHFNKAGHTLQCLAEPFLQILPHLFGIAHQPLIFDDLKHRRRSAHCQRIAAEGRAVIARGKHSVGLFAADESAHGNATAQGLG